MAVPLHDITNAKRAEAADVVAVAVKPSAPSAATPSAADARPHTEAYRWLPLILLVLLLAVGFGVYAHWLYNAPSFGAVVIRTGEWLNSPARPPTSAYALVLGPFAVLVTVVLTLLVRSGLPSVWQSARRSALLGALLGTCLLAAGLLGSGRLARLADLPWIFFVPVVPPMLFGYQALVVWRQRPRSLGRFSVGVTKETLAALKEDGALDRFDATYKQLQRVFGGPRTIPMNGELQGNETDAERKSVPAQTGVYNRTLFVANFAVPGLLLLMVGFGALALANGQALFAPEATRELLLRGLRWGVAGAFVYVLIEFGSRLFRNDLTVGAAIWAIITLIVGPALAVLLSVAWKLDAGASPWQSGVVLFFAGSAPRRVVTIVESIAMQFLKAPNESVAASKVVPLTMLRGVTAEIAVRLREENIGDVYALAYADPVRLVQSLPYDLRQVVDWIDQAQLIVLLPKQCALLQEHGVTGTIDLAWRWLGASLHDNAGTTTIRHADTVPASFRALVNDVEQDAVNVYETARQVFYEEQTCLLWVMYNCFSTTIGEAEAPER